jgi:demethylmenaquinone methyltransferase/2-methoxy-6-polyprenyl-1,4-benzoquinol methylase
MDRQSFLAWSHSDLGDPHAAPDKAARVRHMFNAIAPTYERVNSLFSLGRDAYWRRTAVRMATPSPGGAVLDVACGTGDFARAFADALCGRGRVVACDFARDMLSLGVGRNDRCIRWCEADALRLPIASESQDVVSCAFGVRNFQDLATGLREMHRVLRVGGRVVILEFSIPRRPLLRRLYGFYFSGFMPWLATRISRDRAGAYRYLPSSVLSFHTADEIRQCLYQAGFRRVVSRPLTFGIVTVMVATK